MRTYEKIETIFKRDIEGTKGTERCYLMQNCTATNGKDARPNGATTMAAFGARRTASYCKLDQ